MRVLNALILGGSFVGAGTILKLPDQKKIMGLTTAATLLYSSSTGICIALKQYVLAICITALVIFVNHILPRFLARKYGVTKDSLPYIGTHADYPNSFFVLGFGGNGITFSVMGMSIISDPLKGKDNKFLQYFSFER